MKKLSLTEVEINNIYDITFKGGLSDEINFNNEIIKLRDRIIEITSKNNIYFSDSTRRQHYNELLENLKNIENGSYFYTEETLNNFEKILNNLGIQL